MKWLLRYYGAKMKSGRDIFSFAPATFSHYVEPFCGSAGMLAHVPTSVDRWINDLNPDVVAFHLALRDDPDFLDRIFEFAKLQTAEEIRIAFYKAKWDWFQTGCPVSYWLLNRYAKCRMVRRSRPDIASFDHRYLIRGMRFPFTWEEAEQARAVMQGVRITCLDFREVLANAPADSWVFVDPCYHVKEQIYDKEMSFDDHRDLRDCLVSLREPFLLTTGGSELSFRLYQGRGLDIYQHHYNNVNLLRGGSKPAVEYWIRNDLNS